VELVSLLPILIPVLMFAVSVGAAVVFAIKLRPEAAERAVAASDKSVATMERLLNVLDERDREKDALIVELRRQNTALMLEVTNLQRDRDSYKALLEAEIQRNKEAHA
jgi:hypothetical protein